MKFVTGSDDANLKIFDFAGGVEELLLTGHNWEVKCVDWHPSKGLLVSGSKDHQVKLWDPRNGRCLTTLHGHRSTIARTMFEPTEGQLLATCARDQIARVFDLRMMRDVLLLRGHEKDITTLTWHPIHRNLLSTGGVDGSLFHYLLDEPNLPTSDSSIPSSSISPYDSSDPANAPAQTIYPAHKLPFAHDFAVWALDWHPLGHILASGSNDRVTRFWSRPRPGDTACFSDRYHIGQAAAEAQGTYDRRNGRRQMREQEEQEAEDEAEGLVDQQMPSKHAGGGLPGLIPGINLPGIGSADPPKMSSDQHPQNNYFNQNQKSHSSFPPSNTGATTASGMPMSMPQPNSNLPLAAWPGLEKGQIPDIARLAEMYGRGSGAGSYGKAAPPPPIPFHTGVNGGQASQHHNPPIPYPQSLPPPQNLPFAMPPVSVPSQGQQQQLQQQQQQQQPILPPGMAFPPGLVGLQQHANP